MKTAIIGTGGVGGYFGAKLASTGHDVTFIARGAHLKAMQANGLTVNSILGNFKVEKVKATNNILHIEKPDLIIIGVKAWQIKEIRDDLSKIITKNSIVLPLQNGVLAYDELCETLPKQNILGGLCRIISKIESPGVINHFAVSPEIVFGEMDKSKNPKLESVKSLFEKAGIKSKIATDIEADIWKKFISICVSGLLAVSNTTYGQLIEVPETRQMMVDLLNEIYTLSQKIGVNIKADFVDRTVAFIESFPYSSTSSLTRDVWEKKPSEIEYQNGTVVRLAKIHGLETPINKFIYHCILPGELKARAIKR